MSAHLRDTAAPVAKRIDTRRVRHDDEFVDPHEWMRDKSDPG